MRHVLPRTCTHEAKKDGWIVISMKNDWKKIFAFETINEGGTDE